MIESELALRRSQMGRGIGCIADDTMEAVVEDGWWLVLTGAPSPDLNMALLHRQDPDDLDRVLANVERVGVPALLMIAGDAQALITRLPSEWTDVGSMPIMSVDLDRTPREPDPRVRRAAAADVDVLTALMSEAYDLPAEVVRAMPAVAARDSDMTLWLLEDEGVPVSMVSTARHDDSVSVWGMSTPTRFTRRGYARAVLAHALHEAAADGALVGLLGATPAGFPLYDSTGWRTIEDWRLFVSAPSAQFSA